MSEYHLFICEAAARAVNTFAYFECWVPNDKATRLIYAGGQDLGLVEDDAAKQKINVFKKISERFAFEKGVSSPGRVWKLAAMEFQVDVSQLPVNTFTRNSFAQEAGLKAMLALPIVSKESGEPVAIGQFFRNQTMEFNSRLVDQMSFVVKQLCDNQSLIPHPTSGAALCLQAVNAETCAKLQDADAIESCRQILSLAPVARTSKDIRVLYDLMDGLSFFEQVSEKQRLDLCRCLTFRRVEQNQYVYQIGDSATEAYFLLTGKVKTSCKSQESSDPASPAVDNSSDPSGQSSDNRPNDILLDDSILSPSVARIFFGKKALTNDVNRDETAIAMETSELMVLSKQDYQRAITIPIKDLGFNELAQYFHLSMSEASKFLGVCVTVLKKVCRDRGIVRWPYRKIRSIDNAIEDLENSLSQDVGVTGSKAERIRQEIIELKLQRLQLTKDVKCLNFGVEIDVFGKTHRNVKIPSFTPSNYIKTTGNRKGRKQSKVESEEDSDVEDDKPSPPAKTRKRKHKNASGNSSPAQSQSFSPKAHLPTESAAVNQPQMPSIPQAALSSGYPSQLGSSMNSFNGLGVPGGLGNLGNGLANGLGNGVANLETLMFLASQGINPQLLGMLSPAMGPQMQTPASPLLMNMLASAFMNHSLPHPAVSAPLSSNMYPSAHTPHGAAYHPSSYGYGELSRDPLAFLFANAQTAQASPQFQGASQFDRAFSASMPQPHRPQPRGGSPDSKRRRISEEMHNISGLMNQRSVLESAHRLDVADMAARR
eukprot:GILK01010800.1.p1 GENE.GILK01010800.1~~GILK01010800.1.p1  ORF type:complete len:768 (-),score=133.82 GILK01010800.1:292-2595(-)